MYEPTSLNRTAVREYISWWSSYMAYLY